jgi:hypothetical protein
MNKDDARLVIQNELDRYRSKSFTELRELLQRIDAYGVTGTNGVEYEIEVHAIWDDKPDGNIRVFGEIADKSILRYMFPQCESFVVAPDGQFVGESEA